MKEVNGYHKSFDLNQNNKLNQLKYGYLNNYGVNIDSSGKQEYNEEEIIKKR